MIPIVLVSLGLFNQSILTLNQIFHNRIWISSHIIPFLARIQIELFSCSSIEFNGSFIRIILNSSAKHLPECSQGSGQSCPLHLFTNYINPPPPQY